MGNQEDKVNVHEGLGPDDVAKICDILGAQSEDFGDHTRLYLKNLSEGRKLTLEIYPDILLGKEKGTLLTVYTPNTHL